MEKTAFTIVITTKVDQDVKNAVCQRLSQYKSRLDKMFKELHPYEPYLDTQAMLELTIPLFDEINRQCDQLNDAITRVMRTLDDLRLPSQEDRKRRIFPWFDSLHSWAHDSRAYIQNIYSIVKEGNGRYVNMEDMHSLIALQSALHTMERHVWNEITNKASDSEFMVCEIYKVFDKFKKCYREDARAFSRNKKSAFYRSICCAKGFEAVPLNLYANAFKYLPPDALKIDDIDVCFEESDDGVVISVASVGPFVEKDQIPSLWEKGVRARSAIMATDEGYGLGLPKVKRLCDLSGFGRWITSEHRDIDAEGWGLFSVYISIPKSAYASVN